MRIGQFVILCVPGEFTTMAGRRVREAVAQQVRTQPVACGSSHQTSCRRLEDPKPLELHSLLLLCDATTKTTSLHSAAVRGHAPAPMHSTALAVKLAVTPRLCMPTHAIRSSHVVT